MRTTHVIYGLIASPYLIIPEFWVFVKGNGKKSENAR